MTVARLKIEVVHAWAQRLPLREGTLICISCRQVRRIGASVQMTCAEAAAWTHGAGAIAEGDLLSVPLADILQPRPRSSQPLSIEDHPHA